MPNANAFDRLDSLCSRAVDRTNKSKFQIVFVERTENARPTASVDKAPVEGYGIFDYISIESGIELGVRRSYREANDLRALQVGREPILSVDRKYFTALADEPKQGDKVVFPDRPELPEFDIVSVRRDGLTRFELRLVHRGAQA